MEIVLLPMSLPHVDPPPPGPTGWPHTQPLQGCAMPCPSPEICSCCFLAWKDLWHLLLWLLLLVKFYCLLKSWKSIWTPFPASPSQNLKGNSSGFPTRTPPGGGVGGGEGGGGCLGLCFLPLWPVCSLALDSKMALSWSQTCSRLTAESQCMS